MDQLCVHCTANGKTELICTSGDGDRDECHVCVMNNCNKTCADRCAKLLPVKNYAKLRKPQFCLELCSRKSLRFLEQTMSADNSVSEHIFSPNGGFCLCMNKQIISVLIGVPLMCRGSIYSQKPSLLPEWKRSRNHSHRSRSVLNQNFFYSRV